MRSIVILVFFLSGLLVPALASAAAPMVAAGDSHTVALRSDGTVVAWGYNGLGQLGDGTTTQRLSPVAVQGLSGVVAVAAGFYHSVALKSDGTVWAWGYNGLGQLGDGTSAQRTSPVMVPGLANVVAVAAGAFHSVALKSDGTVWVWGFNAFGQLGDGTTTRSDIPEAVPGLVGVAAVAAGYAHTVVLKADGTVVAWGLNQSGQLGDGTTANSLVPVAVPSLAGVLAVAAGNAHTVALESDGTVAAWGQNQFGQLGDGTTTDSPSPAPVPGLAGVLAIAAGYYHTVALAAGGTVVAWGRNQYGQLGDGTTTDNPSPATVPGLAGVLGVAAGDGHTVALEAGDAMAAWGWNQYGQLGDGTTTDRSSPVAVIAQVKVGQTVSFGTRPALVAGGTGTVSATATSGLAVSFTSTTPGVCTVSGSTVTGATVGTCIIVANQPGDASYFAATPVAQSIVIGCDMASAVTMTNTCAPEARLYVAGSSALGSAVATVLQADLFDTAALPVITILDQGSANGNTVSAWYGMSKAALTGGSSKRLFVVFNDNNGSAAGVSQLLVKEDPARAALLPEADVVTVGPPGKATVNTCTFDLTSTPSAPVVACTSHAATQADIAVSAVNMTELYRLETTSSGKLGRLSTLSGAPLGLQGFGVAVNANLYAALQTANLAEGLIPASCTAGDTSAACQPTIRRADYASLVSGAIKSAAGLLNNSDATQLTLARFGDLSGTQAASNIFFADNPCGNNLGASGNAIKGALGGQLRIVAAAESTAALAIEANATVKDVIASLNAPGGYAIGVLGLGAKPGAGDTWRFVRLDGVSPNFNADGTPDADQRNTFIHGYYPFAMTFFAVTPVKPSTKATGKLFPNVITAVVNGLKDSTLHNFTGIGYLDHAANSAQSLVEHGGSVGPLSGNNCAPLVKM